MKQHFLNLGLFSVVVVAMVVGGSAERDSLAKIMEDFAAGYSQHAAQVGLRYEDVLPQAGQSAVDFEASQVFFEEIKARLSALPMNERDGEDALEYEILWFETGVQLERLALCLDYLEHPPVVEGLPVNWYGYLVKAWTSTNISPEAVEALGYRLADEFLGKLKALEVEPRLPLEEGSAWLTADEAQIEATYAATHANMLGRVSSLFPDFEELPTLGFAPVASPQMGQVPGYYSSNTLYYNTFRAEYDLRQVDWLYIHEAVPGHHFQVQYEDARSVPVYREDMAWGGFREGWAAYVEEDSLGQALGLYQTPDALASMYQWNLIRSVRLVLDVGLNTGELSDAEALEIWGRYLPDMEAVGQREIDRMRRWPAQVLTYMVGREVMLEARQAEMERLGDVFDLKDFHTTLLSQRSIPVACIPRLFD